VYRKGSILIGGRNFGCGSSREHAPWALSDFGFRVVIAPSFADIFFNNCAKNGMLTVILSEEQVAELAHRAREKPGHQLTVDLETQTVSDDQGFRAAFSIDPFKRHCLLHGLDDISLTLQHEADIEAFEKKRVQY
jgi:3-isopropylmalate/(R)-2-methylmalate dehydratase small subunit